MSVQISKSKIKTIEDTFCYLIQRSTSGVFVIEGPPDTGKTNGAMYWAEITHDRGLFKEGMQATNVHMLDGETSHLEFIADLESLRTWLETNPNVRKMYILDEAAKTFPKRTPMAKDNIEMLKEIQTLRHFDLWLFIVTQDPDRLLDSGLLNPIFCQGRLKKPVYKKPHIYQYNDLIEPYEVSCYGDDFPPTTIPYNPKRVTTFTRYPPIDSSLHKPDWLQRALNYGKTDGRKKEIWGSDRKKSHTEIRRALRLLEGLYGRNKDIVKGVFQEDEGERGITPSK